MTKRIAIYGGPYAAAKGGAISLPVTRGGARNGANGRQAAHDARGRRQEAAWQFTAPVAGALDFAAISEY